MSTAVFLGAGASKAFGYPLTNEILPRLLTRLEAGELFDGANSGPVNKRDRDWFRRGLFNFLPGLADAWRRAKKDGELGVTVTDLLTLVDRAIQHADARAHMASEELIRFRRLLERAIYESLLRNSSRQTRKAQDTLTRFVDWLDGLDKPVSIVTTNYDTAIDSRLFKPVGHAHSGSLSGWVAANVDLGFPWRRIDDGALVQRPASPKWNLYKLHGSVSWLRCSLCGQIYHNAQGPIGSLAFTTKLNDWNTCHCNGWLRLNLHLVTPSLVRQTNDAHLLGISQASVEALRTATQWVIIGYSLPAEDVAIRSLFLRAWEGRRRKPRVTVVQGSAEATERVYRSFFPARHLTYHRNRLEGFLSSLP